MNRATELTGVPLMNSSVILRNLSSPSACNLLNGIVPSSIPKVFNALRRRQLSKQRGNLGSTSMPFSVLGRCSRNTHSTETAHYNRYPASTTKMLFRRSTKVPGNARSSGRRDPRLLKIANQLTRSKIGSKRELYTLPSSRAFRFATDEPTCISTDVLPRPCCYAVK